MSNIFSQETRQGLPITADTIDGRIALAALKAGRGEAAHQDFVREFADKQFPHLDPETYLKTLKAMLIMERR